MLLGFSMISFTMGYSYLFNGNKPTSLGWISDLIPLPIFGFLWVGIGVWLAISAFSVNQGPALGAFSGISAAWGIAYLIASIINLLHSNIQGAYILVPIFWGMSIACASSLKMVNPARSHVVVIMKTGEGDNFSDGMAK